jgi:hypothetical protein
MIKFPVGLTPTKYPGYFWHVAEQKLYSIKVGGVLRPIKLSYPSKFNKLQTPAYQVSHKGNRVLLSLIYLRRMATRDHTIQYDHETED